MSARRQRPGVFDYDAERSFGQATRGLVAVSRNGQTWVWAVCRRGWWYPCKRRDVGARRVVVR